MSNERALLIDRDGVMIHMVRYDYGWDSAQKPEDVSLVKGVDEIIAWANKEGIPVIEISNQPGIAKGKMSQEISNKIEKRTHELLVKNGAKVDNAYICQHHPKGVIAQLTCECDCRKPKPGLLLQAAKDLNIDLTASVFLGDKASDVEVGKQVDCKTIIFLHDEDLPEKIEEAINTNADYKTRSMKKVLSILEMLY
jgi:D-glycero-D-manno-heptose 1,7-bisphosphate phosphatase